MRSSYLSASFASRNIGDVINRQWFCIISEYLEKLYDFNILWTIHIRDNCHFYQLAKVIFVSTTFTL